jgi:hypothetical protein
MIFVRLVMVAGTGIDLNLHPCRALDADSDPGSLERLGLCDLGRHW